MTDAKAPAIGGRYGEVPTDALSDADHKVTGGRLTRLNPDGTEMEGMGYDYTLVPESDDDGDETPPVQENAPEPLPGGIEVSGFFSGRVSVRQLASGTAMLIESDAPRSTVSTDIPSLRADDVEDIFFRHEDTLTHFDVDKMAEAAGEDADVELKQDKEDISLRLDGERRDDLSERYLEWVPEDEELLKKLKKADLSESDLSHIDGTSPILFTEDMASGIEIKSNVTVRDILYLHGNDFGLPPKSDVGDDPDGELYVSIDGIA